MKASYSKYFTAGSSRPKWRFRVSIGKKENGKYAYEGNGGYKTQGDAEDGFQEWLRARKQRQQKAAVSESGSLGDWLKRWLETFAPHTCEPKTLERYTGLARYITDAADGELRKLADTAVSALKRAQLRSAFYALFHARALRRQHVSAHTVRHVAGVVSVALNEAVEQELLPSNPMFRLKLPQIEKRDVRSLSQDEIAALRAACRGDWTFCLVELALATGARRGELLCLKWSDLNWVAKTIAITKSLEQTRDGLRIKLPKSRKARTFALPQAALAALQFQRDQQAEHRRQFGPDYHSDLDLVLCSPDGDFLDPALVSQTIVRRLGKAGVKDASLHSLRHSHASILLSRGVPISAVSARLGHADSSITHRIYIHPVDGDDQRGADAWDEVLTGRVQ